VTRIRLKYIHEFRDRHGKPRHYFRRPGFKRVALPGLPGSTEYMAAYAEALAEAPRVEIGTKRTIAGTVNAMIVGYLATAAFHKLAPASQEQYRRIFEGLRRDHGNRGIATLERRHIVLMLDAKAETPSAARDFLRCLRLLVQHAIEHGIRSNDPTAGVRVKVPRTGGFRTWTEDDIAAFEATYPLISSKPRLALALLLGTALRCADVVRVGRGNIRNGTVCNIAQQKTGGLLPPIPISAALADAINAAAPSEHITLLINERGASFTAKAFGKWFSKQCARAGLKGLSAHGLRKAACRRLAEAGCSANEIAAISGHQSLNEIARYTRAADQARMARNAMARMDGQHQLANLPAGSGKPGSESR
jgi:integrase